MDGDAPAKKRARRDETSKVDEAENEKPTSSTQTSNESGRPVKRKVPVGKQVKPTKILDLNEHCLLELMQRMNLADICTLAEVNVHFKEVAQKFFATNHRYVSLSLLADETGKFTLVKARQMLYNFGSLISSLTMDLNDLNPDDDCGKLIFLVRKYCFNSIDEFAFVNQNNQTMEQNIMASLLGIELIHRNVTTPGVYTLRSKMVYQPGQSIQTQFIERIN